MGKLNILWTTKDKDTAHNMVLLYATNSKLNNWWDEVQVIVWGASARIVAEDEGVREKIKLAMHAGVKFVGCLGCAVNLGVADKISELGIKLEYYGESFTEIIKEGEHLITI